MVCKKNYLSPSNQVGNMYGVGNVSEKEVMEEIANHLREILINEYGCDTLIAPSSLGVRERPQDALDNNAEVYLALHSNAGGGRTASGAIAFYHPNDEDSRRLAANIVAELNKISQYPSNRIDPVRSGMEVFNNQGYYEIRVPNELGLIPVLVEIDFHDNPLTARYLIDNTYEIAQALARAIDSSFNLRNKRRYIMSFTRRKGKNRP